jgi:pimeloyl-ACP methyl ester carboxylesterase
MDRFAIAALTRSRSDQVIAPALASIVTVPTLAIVGNQDTFITPLRALKELRPNLKLIVIDGATHGGPRGILTRSELTSTVREFLAVNKVIK